MEYSVFKEYINQAKEKKPKLFGLGHDRIVSDQEIAAFESAQGISLSRSHKAVLKEFGGGYFGFTIFYSLDEDSDFYIQNHLRYAPTGYLPVSDNGCGDLYLQRIEDIACGERLYLYEHGGEEPVVTKYTDVFEYLVEVGLKMTVE